MFGLLARPLILRSQGPSSGSSILLYHTPCLLSSAPNGPLDKDFSKLWEQGAGVENQISGGDSWAAQLKKPCLADGVRDGGNPNAARAADSVVPSDSAPNKSE